MKFAKFENVIRINCERMRLMRMRSRFTALLLVFAIVLMTLPVTLLAAAQSDPDNGDWSSQHVSIRNTSEADLMVRIGDIDNCGFGYPEDYSPFTAEKQTGHPFPWDPDPVDADGTDRVMIGTGYKGDYMDGYSERWAFDPVGTTTRPIKMIYDASGISIKSALLQLLVDDFQAPEWGSQFTVTINGKDAPFVAEILNHVVQTGPTAFIMSADIPESFFKDIASGSLSIHINDATTGKGDGFAIDFVKLLVNYNRSKYISTISGFVKNIQGVPIEGATVRVLGTRNTVKTGANGNFTAEVIAGLNVFRASKDGYIENYKFCTIPSGKTLDLRDVASDEYNDIYLANGKGSADINYLLFAAGNSWSDASAWATEELKKADELGIIPDSLKGENLTKSITRAEFAAIAVKVYENLANTLAIPAMINPFKDTTDVEVLKAFNTGLMVGISIDRFDPNALLNREQAATALTRVFKRATIPEWTFATDVNYVLNFVWPTRFLDDAQISSWAKESVYFMVSNDIIKGVGNNKFAPRAITSIEQAQGYASATREQALVIALRMIENLKGKSASYSLKQ